MKGIRRQMHQIYWHERNTTSNGGVKGVGSLGFQRKAAVPTFTLFPFNFHLFTLMCLQRRGKQISRTNFLDFCCSYLPWHMARLHFCLFEVRQTYFSQWNMNKCEVCHFQGEAFKCQHSSLTFHFPVMVIMEAHVEIQFLSTWLLCERWMEAAC